MNEKSTRNPAYTRPHDPTDPGCLTTVRTVKIATPTETRTAARRYIERYAERRDYTTTELAQVLDMLGLSDPPPNAKTRPAPRPPLAWVCGTIPGWLTHVELSEPPCGPCDTARCQYAAARTTGAYIPRSRGRGIDAEMVTRAVDGKDRDAATALTADERLAGAVRILAGDHGPATVSRRLGLGYTDARRLVDLITAPPIDAEQVA